MQKKAATPTIMAMMMMTIMVMIILAMLITMVMIMVMIRGAAGDELVGVTSIFGSAARARVNFFFKAWYAPYHQKTKKERWAHSGARADPKVQAQTLPRLLFHPTLG